MNALVLLLSLVTVYGVSAQRVQVDQGEILLSTVPNDTVDPSQVRFALISSNRATVRATLGPYSSSQTVYHNRSDADVSAHVVHSVVYRHSPQVRVVFHANQRDFRSLCITLYGQLADSKKASLLAKCQPVKENSACMAELIVPADWWPAAWLESGNGGSSSGGAYGGGSSSSTGNHKMGKKSKPHIELSYATSDDLNCQMGGLNSELKANAAKESPPKHIARLPLSPIHATYEKITLKESPVEVFLPETPFYPNNVVYAPVFVRQGVRQFSIGANLVGGLQVERLEPVAKHVWKVAIETTANKRIRISCSRIDNPMDTISSSGQAEHVFDVLLRVDPEPDVSTDQTIEWVVNERVEALSQLNVQKDKVQNILMITKTRDLINTAIITGSQVSQLVKLIMISEAGQMSDVTHKAACHSSDESVLKVSPSCTSVYLDGSEIRSSANVSIHVKYSGHMSESHFTVWTPETPFTISVSDEKLSHIKQWHAPATAPHSYHRNALPKDECKLRFQQSIVKVYTRFVSINHNSGRENYLLGKRRLIADITDMVHIRSSNSHVASFVTPNILSGVHPGKADIQVVSPTTGKILATRSVRVTAEKEVITALNARVVSGLNLAVSSDATESASLNGRDSSNGHSERAIYLAKVSIDEKLTSRYQEAVLDVTLRFSDGSEMPLENFNPSEYNISVESLDSNVIVVAPNQIGNTGAHPRIICVGQGSGDLLSVTLETSDLCVKRGGAIQDAAVYVSCMLTNPDNYLYQDAQVPRKYSAAVTFELQPQIHKNAHYPQAAHHLNHLNGSPLQVGLYTLFGVFCMALLAFVASCSVFAVHIKNTRQQSSKDNSQDWVWLSKETLEQAVRPKNVSKFANIVVNPMGDLDNRNLGNFVCSDGFGANICQNGDLLRQQQAQHLASSSSSSSSSSSAQHHNNLQRQNGSSSQAEMRILSGRTRLLPSEPIDVRNNNVPADNNNSDISINMNQHAAAMQMAAAAAADGRTPALASSNNKSHSNSNNHSHSGNNYNGSIANADNLSFNQIFGGGAEGIGVEKALSSSTDSGVASGHNRNSPAGDQSISAGASGLLHDQQQHHNHQNQRQHSPQQQHHQHTLFDLGELTVRPNLLAEVEDRLDSSALQSSAGSKANPSVLSASSALSTSSSPTSSSSENGSNSSGGASPSAGRSAAESQAVSPSSCATRSIIVNPIEEELAEGFELEPPPVPPHRQTGTASGCSGDNNPTTNNNNNNVNNSDTLNWRRLERQYNNNRKKLAEYLDSLQESIA
ncbi:transmembrane protein 132C-like [Varroa jacobsoni]|uniref:transmembrane protein 132C-like n=1 Tax=Varroa jacobsoni TaxID=62625 RepID=UPI000BF6E5D0|nr:transmembrane protein 132C-like [Varroa jacobsoni]